MHLEGSPHLSQHSWKTICSCWSIYNIKQNPSAPAAADTILSSCWGIYNIRQHPSAPAVVYAISCNTLLLRMKNIHYRATPICFFFSIHSIKQHRSAAAAALAISSINHIFLLLHIHPSVSAASCIILNNTHMSIMLHIQYQATHISFCCIMCNIKQQ